MAIKYVGTATLVPAFSAAPLPVFASSHWREDVKQAQQELQWAAALVQPWPRWRRLGCQSALSLSYATLVQYR